MRHSLSALTCDEDHALHRGREQGSRTLLEGAVLPLDALENIFDPLVECRGIEPGGLMQYAYGREPPGDGRSLQAASGRISDVKRHGLRSSG